MFHRFARFGKKTILRFSLTVCHQVAEIQRTVNNSEGEPIAMDNQQGPIADLFSLTLKHYTVSFVSFSS